MGDYRRKKIPRMKEYGESVFASGLCRCEYRDPMQLWYMKKKKGKIVRSRVGENTNAYQPNHNTTTYLPFSDHAEAHHVMCNSIKSAYPAGVLWWLLWRTDVVINTLLQGIYTKMIPTTPSRPELHENSMVDAHFLQPERAFLE